MHHGYTYNMGAKAQLFAPSHKPNLWLLWKWGRGWKGGVGTWEDLLLTSFPYIVRLGWGRLQVMCGSMLQQQGSAQTMCGDTLSGQG